MSTDAEWKEAYRTGLEAALVVVKAVADDNGTAAEAATLLEALSESHVLDTPKAKRSSRLPDIQVFEHDLGGNTRKLWPPEPPANT